MKKRTSAILLVIFNATSTPVNFSDTRLEGMHLHLHPVLLNSNDPVVKQSSFNGRSGSVNVPALTTAVFVQ